MSVCVFVRRVCNLCSYLFAAEYVCVFLYVVNWWFVCMYKQTHTSMQVVCLLPDVSVFFCGYAYVFVCINSMCAFASFLCLCLFVCLIESVCVCVFLLCVVGSLTFIKRMDEKTQIRMDGQSNL